MRFAKSALDILYRDLNDLDAGTQNSSAQTSVNTDPIRVRDQLELQDVQFFYPQADRQTLTGLGNPPRFNQVG